jgi:small conductance mechanosensitive channel
MGFLDRKLVEQAVPYAPKLALAAAVFALILVASRLASAMLRRMGARKRIQPELLLLAAHVTRVAGAVLATVTALGTLGVNVSAAVAGLGLTGLGLSLAFKEVLTNFLSGILILVYRPFRGGDHVTIEGNDGNVSEVNLRYTVLVSQGERILIPNSKVLTDVVKVHGKRAPTVAKAGGGARVH